MIYILYLKYHTKNYGYDSLISKVFHYYIYNHHEIFVLSEQKFVSHFNGLILLVFFMASILFRVLS